MNDEGAHVPVVDDEALTDVYSSWLSDQYSVETAPTGEAALNHLTGEVDVVLLDRRVPGLSGEEVLTRIRALRERTGTTVTEVGFEDFRAAFRDLPDENIPDENTRGE